MASFNSTNEDQSSLVTAVGAATSVQLQPNEPMDLFAGLSDRRLRAVGLLGVNQEVDNILSRLVRHFDVCRQLSTCAQLCPTLTKLCHIKRDYLVHII